jgi:hypothetical protein
MRTETLFKLSGIAAVLGGGLRLAEPLLKRVLEGQQLQLAYFAIDVFLLLGLIGWYGWRADKLGIAGVIGFVAGVFGILIIRSANLFAPQGYVIGATALLLGLAVMNVPTLMRRDGPICPPLLWLAAFVCGMASLAFAPLAIAAGVLFGLGYIFAGVALLRA